jgi:hypothetical protein
LAATPALDKEPSLPDDGGALALRDEDTVVSIAQAQRLQQHVVHILQEMGQVVAFGDHAGSALRSDPVFEYFCESNMLQLWVKIIQAKPDSSSGNKQELKLHACTWSPAVKSQVLLSLSLLLSNAQDQASLYYLLSNHNIHVVLTTMLPLHQWTDAALRIMMLPYVKLLQQCVGHISASPKEVLVFFVEDDDLPLLSCIIEIAVSNKSDPASRASCLTLIIEILRLQSLPGFTHLMSSCCPSHFDKLIEHLCSQLWSRHKTMANLLIGPVVDPTRSHALQGLLKDLQMQLRYINALLHSSSTLAVSLCERLLSSVIAPLLAHLVCDERHFLAVGVSDIDVIPLREGFAQLTVVFLVHFFASVTYPPLAKMLVVALLHPRSNPSLWSDEQQDNDFAMTRHLHAIVQDNPNDDTTCKEDNPYRRELLSILSGSTGEWRFIPVSMLVEAVLTSKAIGTDVLISFGLLPDLSSFCDGAAYPESPLEEALAAFLKLDHASKSVAATLALQQANSTSSSILSRLIQQQQSVNRGFLERFLPQSPLSQALADVHHQFCEYAIEAQKTKTGVSELFVDLTLVAVRSRYPKLSSYDRHGCVLGKFSYRSLISNSEVLIRKFRVVGSNDVEDCRFAIEMTLQFRSTCRMMQQAIAGHNEQPNDDAASNYVSAEIDWADNVLLTIGDLKAKPANGSDLNLRGRVAFPFHTASGQLDGGHVSQIKDANRQRSLSDDIVLRQSSHLVLVLDPTDLFVVKPIRQANRGTIICAVSLRRIIAFASDGQCLHIAVRNMPDVGFLVKNGNMALHFDDAGTCLIVKQFLDRSQSLLRNELKDQIDELFHEIYQVTDPH